MQPVLRNRNRRNRIILTQEEPKPYPCSRFRFLLHKKYQTKSTLKGALADTCMKLAREETKTKVTGRSFYRKNNLKFKCRYGNLSRNRGKKSWDPEPEPELEPRLNGTAPQHCIQLSSTVLTPKNS
jgi:hypothetical protein